MMRLLDACRGENAHTGSYFFCRSAFVKVNASLRENNARFAELPEGELARVSGNRGPRNFREFGVGNDLICSGVANERV